MVVATLSADRTRVELRYFHLTTHPPTYLHQCLADTINVFTAKVQKSHGSMCANARHLVAITHQEISHNLIKSCRRSCSSSAGRRVEDFGHLRAGTVDTVAVLVLDDHRILVLLVRALPDLDFHAAADDTHSHGGEEVVRSVAVVVDAAVEHGGSILADSRADHSLATWMIADEVRDIVHDACDGDEAAAVGGLVDVVVPFHDGELVERDAPVEFAALLVEFLLLLLHATLLDLVGLELLKVVGEADLLAEPDGPLGGVILVPLDGVAVVGRKLVMEVVVAFAESDEGSDDVVAGAVAVVEGLVAQPMCQRVDAEGGLLHEEDAQDAGVDEAAKPVVPAKAGDDAREDQTHEKDDLEVVLVLPDDNGIVVEIGDVGAANSLGVLLHEHPAEVRVEQALADAVGILVGVGVAVMGTVISGPPSDRALNCTASEGSPEDLEGCRGRV